MRRDEVRRKIQSVIAMMREEQDLKDQLATLEVIGSPEEVEKARVKQAKLIAAIEAIRYEQMLPLVREVAEFVAAAKAAR